MTSKWRIEMLGDLVVMRNDQKLPSLPTLKSRELLICLALWPGRLWLRSELGNLLWPEADPETARHRLRTEINRLDGVLRGEGYASPIQRPHGALRIEPLLITTDVAEFEAAIRTGKTAKTLTEQAEALAHSASLYSGSLVIPDSDRENKEIRTERMRLGTEYCSVLMELARAHKRSGNLTAGIAYARSATGHEYSDVGADELLIELLMAAGQSEEARRHQRNVERMLSDKLARSPSSLRKGLRENHIAHGEAGGNPGADGPIRSIPFALHVGNFFGRESEMESFRARLASSPRRNASELICVIGPGGCGKTRLAIEFARIARETYGGALWFVSLAEISDPALIPALILQAMGIPQASKMEPLNQVISRLNTQHALLILDNLEHLLPAARSTLQVLCAQVSGLCVIVTSRRQMRLPNEDVLHLAPLPVPDLTSSLETLRVNPAVALFEARARRERPTFSVYSSNAHSIARVCIRLDGMPLAIELVAPRVKSRTPGEILAELEERLGKWKNASSRAPCRHRTLHTAIAWSYDQLPSSLKQLFAGLSVFRGSFTPEAAATVCNSENASEGLYALEELSLVVRETGSVGEPRFRLLETLRHFGARIQTIAEREALAVRHADYYLKVLETLAPDMTGGNAQRTSALLKAERDNLRAALDQLERSSRWEQALVFSGMMGTFWGGQGFFEEGRMHLGDALAHCPNHTRTRCVALIQAGSLARRQGNIHFALPLLEEALVLARLLDDDRCLAETLCSLGYAVHRQAEFARARDLHAESLAIARRIGDQSGIAVVLNLMALAVRQLGDPDKARELLEESRRCHLSQGDRRGAAMALSNLGLVAKHQMDFETARRCYLESLEVFRELGNRLNCAVALHALSTMALMEGDLVEGRRLLAEAVPLLLEMDEKALMSECLYWLSRSDTGQKHWEYAIRLNGASKTLREAAGVVWAESMEIEFGQSLAGLRTFCSDATFDALWKEGCAFTPKQAFAYAFQTTTSEI